MKATNLQKTTIQNPSSPLLNSDVNNGIARRSWARNDAAMFAIKEAMKTNKDLRVTIPNVVDDKIIDDLFEK